MKKLGVLLLVLFWIPAAAFAETHHDLRVELDPLSATIHAKDIITLSPRDRDRPVSFLIAEQLEITGVLSTVGFTWDIEPGPDPADFFTDPDSSDIELTKRAKGIVLTSRYDQWPEKFAVTITYHGVIYDTLQAPSKSYSKGFATTSGLIDTAGCFLAGGTLWIPTLIDDFFAFDLDVRTPPGWESISQGERTRHEVDESGAHAVWHCPHPMEECYLVAGPFHIESRTYGNVEALTYLRTPDPKLSDDYLSATRHYLEMYENLIGPYPFAKFALVENFWQTGYGMPSFTLLGDRVIRLPWIVHTSYGHEILHNWWGNGVYVDWDRGNWCEGLTVFGADYRYKEKAGADEARQYRLETLANYLNYVKTSDEIPLTEFRERHGASSQAVGYGKSMMVFYMLRDKMGNDLFWKSLALFYERNLFRKATWDDLRHAFEETSGLDLSSYFEQWVDRVGAPLITIESASLRYLGDTARLEASIRQSAPPYRMDVPLRFETADRETTWTVPLTGTLTSVRLDVPRGWVDSGGKSIRIDLLRQRLPDTLHVETAADEVRFSVDPDFDVFRLIDREEVPPTLGELLGADSTLIVLPAEADEAVRTFAEGWAERGAAHILGNDVLPGNPPTPGAVLFFEMPDTLPNVVRAPDHWKVQGTPVARESHTLVFTIRDSHDPESSYTWILTEKPAILASLSRRLPHYGKYSFLVIENASGRVIDKGIWKLDESPMIVRLAAEDKQAKP